MMQKKWAVRVIAIVLAVLMVATTLTVLLNVFYFKNTIKI